MHIHPYLTFDGRCREAFSFYQKVLGGKLEIMTHGESPIADQTPPDQRDRVLHARLDLGDAVLMGADAPPQYASKPQGFSVSIGLPDTEECGRVFHGLSEGGNVMMPFQKTFWSEGFGMCVDRFGTPWMVNSEKAS